MYNHTDTKHNNYAEYLKDNKTLKSGQQSHLKDSVYEAQFLKKKKFMFSLIHFHSVQFGWRWYI